MATLKSIKNKYLTASDGTVLGVTTNTENVSLLSFKLATADSLSKFNLVDGFSDDYNDATGVDAGGSSDEVRDTSGKYYSGTEILAGQTNGYTSSGTHTGFRTGTAEVLVVAGGGGGGGGQCSPCVGGAGGAGGLVYHATYSIVKDVVYDFTVGTGGAGPGGVLKGNNGVSSVWNVNAEGSGSTMTADEGIGGGGSGTVANSATPGGSGGGAGKGINDNRAGGQADSGGGTGFSSAGGAGSGVSGGGGGGAGAVGVDGSGGVGGYGGIGKLYSSFVAYGTTSANVASSGSDGGYFAGGGGAGGNAAPPSGPNYALGGAGGGGNGQTDGGQGTSALANTGGGGGSSYQEQGMPGGSGFVGVSYPVVNNYNNMTLASNAYTAQADPATIRIMVDEYTSTGSATINTDIKAYASRDNGTTYTQITLADQGTIETNHRYLSGSVDISGQPAGSNVKYKIETLNQSVSKVTRVYGTSMAWA